jgi:hypothetical protein
MVLFVSSWEEVLSVAFSRRAFPSGTSGAPGPPSPPSSLKAAASSPSPGTAPPSSGTSRCWRPLYMDEWLPKNDGWHLADDVTNIKGGGASLKAGPLSLRMPPFGDNAKPFPCVFPPFRAEHQRLHYGTRTQTHPPSITIASPMGGPGRPILVEEYIYRRPGNACSHLRNPPEWF